eukprot:3358789-Pyramimonas_sp.AAC.1
MRGIAWVANPVSPRLSPLRYFPDPGQLLARATQDLDAMEYYECHRVVASLMKHELAEKFPLVGRRKICSAREPLQRKPVRRRAVERGVFGIDGPGPCLALLRGLGVELHVNPPAEPAGASERCSDAESDPGPDRDAGGEGNLR